MSSLVFQIQERLSREAKLRWMCSIVDHPLAEIAIDWCETLQNSVDPGHLEIRYIEVFSSDGIPLALGVVHTIRRLDLPEFMGALAKRVFSGIGKVGLHPLRLDISFLELPLLNASGLLLTNEGKAQAGTVALELVEFVKGRFESDIFNFKSMEGEPGFGGMGLMETNFLANMLLTLPYASFDDYYRSRSANSRYRIRRDRKMFAAAGGAIREETDLAKLAPLVHRLFKTTCERHVARGDLPYPIRLDERFFVALNGLPENRRRVFLAEVNGETVGFALTVQSGDQLYFTKCGLDYEKAEPTRAYFNLYYAMIEYAIGSGLTAIDLGAEAYDAKRKVGAVPVPTRYQFEINHRWIGPAIRLIVKHFSGQKGANQKVEAIPS